MTRTPLQLACGLTLWVAFAMAAHATPTHPLAQFGYGATASEVRRCLAQFVPSAERKQETVELIKQLGDPKFSVRENAHTRLAQFAVLPRAELGKAAERGDSEMKARIEQILSHRTQSALDKIWHDALRQIIQFKHKGLASDVLSAAAQIDSESFWALLSEALVVTSTPDDAETLSTSLTASRADVRAAAARALVIVHGKRAARPVKVQLSDEDPRVALGAAKLLAYLGDRDCLPTLLRMLEAEKIGLRLGAVQVLRKVSSKRFGYSTSGSSTQRRQAVDTWRKWAEGDGKTMTLGVLSLDDLD